jgi:hypothetical protein
MTPNEIANLSDLAISMAGGVLATLFGYRIIGKTKPLDAWRDKWGKHLRWIGPAPPIFYSRWFAISSLHEHAG